MSIIMNNIPNLLQTESNTVLIAFEIGLERYLVSSYKVE